MPDEPDLSRFPALKMRLYVIVSTQAGTDEAFAQGLPAHIERQHDLERQGVLFAAGPITDAAGTLQGLIVIRAASLEDARAIADADPFHQAGVRTYELFEWSLNQGSLSLSLRLSHQGFTIR